MKKTLLRISLLSCAFAALLLLAGCEQPTSSPASDDSSYRGGDIDMFYGDIGVIQNLKVDPYIGANLLTWDPLTDAESYEVYRREKVHGDWGAYKKLSSAADIFYLDIIRDNNVLQDDGTYMYKIIAKSGNTVLGSSSSDFEYKTDAGKFPKDKNPQFPAKNKFPVAAFSITEAAITVDKIYGTATVTWKAENNPAIRYKVEKSRFEGSSSAWELVEGATTAMINLSDSGGMIDAYIIPSFNGGYYPAVSEPVYIEPVVYEVQHSSSINAAIDSAYRIEGGSKVLISFSKVRDGQEYILQKAVINGSGAAGAWMDIDTDITTNPAMFDLGSSYEITDDSDANAWRYRLLVRTSSGISQPAERDVPADPSVVGGGGNAVAPGAVSGKLSSVTVTTSTHDSMATDGIDDTLFGVVFTIENAVNDNDHTYTLQYRKIGTGNQEDVDNAKHVGEWKSVTINGDDAKATWGQGSGGAIYTITFKPPAQRQLYQYRIRAEQITKTDEGDVIEAKVMEASSIPDAHGKPATIQGSNVRAFALKPALSISVQSGTIVNEATGFTYTINNLSSPMMHIGESIDVYGYKKTTDLTTSTSVTETERTYLGIIEAQTNMTSPIPANNPTAGTNSLLTPGTDVANTTSYEWVNLSYVYNNVK
jgi:hypothetical protein